jgi:hypothetical protein
LGIIGFIANTWYPSLTLLTLFVIGGILLFTYLLYYQMGVDDTEYMLAMIEHHQAAIDRTLLVRPKVTDPELLELMDVIIESQRREIKKMKKLLHERGVQIN